MIVKVKICGITNLQDAKAAVEYGADAIGFIFYKKSPRYISSVEAARIRVNLNPFILSVGVFVDAPYEEIRQTIEEVGLDAVQFHGNESPEFCRIFETKVIKAFRIKDESSIEICNNYPGFAWLLDTYNPDIQGGTGKAFDWDIALKAKALNQNIILSGGLTPENVAEAIKRVKPIAVDVSSGVELFPGKKDKEKIKSFIHAAKTALLE
jgi:phosphoribosylanthranilate isomerase